MASSEIRAHVRSRVPTCCMAELPAPGADLGWNSELGDLLAVHRAGPGGWQTAPLGERGLPSPLPWGQHSRLCAASTCPGNTARQGCMKTRGVQDASCLGQSRAPLGAWAQPCLPDPAGRWMNPRRLTVPDPQGPPGALCLWG